MVLFEEKIVRQTSAEGFFLIIISGFNKAMYSGVVPSARSARSGRLIPGNSRK